MQDGMAATREVFIGHAGIPILAAIRPAVPVLQGLNMRRKVQPIVSGGIRNGAAVAKALAPAADAPATAPAAPVAPGNDAPACEADDPALGSTAGAQWLPGQRLAPSGRSPPPAGRGAYHC